MIVIERGTVGEISGDFINNNAFSVFINSDSRVPIEISGSFISNKGISLPALYLETTRYQADSKILKLFEKYNLPFNHENLKQVAEESHCPPSVIKMVEQIQKRQANGAALQEAVRNSKQK